MNEFFAALRARVLDIPLDVNTHLVILAVVMAVVFGNTSTTSSDDKQSTAAAICKSDHCHLKFPHD